MNSNTNLIILILVIAAGAYWYFFTDTGNDAPIVASEYSNADETRFRDVIVKLPTAFDGKIFSDARFAALVDIATQISPEVAGRVDPFAGISGAGASGAQTSRTNRR